MKFNATASIIRINAKLGCVNSQGLNLCQLIYFPNPWLISLRETICGAVRHLQHMVRTIELSTLSVCLGLDFQHH